MEHPARRHAEHLSFDLADIDQPIERLAIDQRLEIAPHEDIGRRLARFGITVHADRMVGSCHDFVVDIRHKFQSVFDRIEVNRNEWRVLYADTDFFNRRDKKIVLTVLSNDRRKQFDHRRTPNGRAEIEPSSIALDLHVDVPTERRIPLFDRGQTLF